eukprot:CAMPEP_0195134004 /NCGR_PEP_ID=MMETSP0448-20130528/149817_1 /TAXON_ID=66468 /ORGANISM="Heterocapsa triquestra, Strain CCMP 448" /LENGTH=196 /DNA_ID=CAMNT_0040172085 /DNA_START=11 /DNA_END=601 /DNA_ORIENTATION=+
MSGGGSSLQVFLNGFNDLNFQSMVQAFVAERAGHFTQVCEDGSQPLIWTQFHQEYKAVFEQQLDNVLRSVGMPAPQFQEFCGWLQECYENIEEDWELPGSGGVKAGDFAGFIDFLTSSEDYDAFLRVMLAEAQRQQAAVAAAAQPGQTIEIDVACPEGMGPGQMIAVDYAGARYELQVPEGVAPGMTFRAAVLAPA